MFLFQGVQDVLQQQGDSGGQGSESFRYLGKEEDGFQRVGRGEEVVLVVDGGVVGEVMGYDVKGKRNG